MASGHPYDSDTFRRTLALRDYAAVGGGPKVAILGLDGAIHRLSVPELDSMPLVDALSDTANGGILGLRPSDSYGAEHRYRNRSSVLETAFTNRAWRVKRSGRPA